MVSKPFKFKQFTIAQDRCAMKIGTDGVLLGAWTSLDPNLNSILDLGTGTGVIALQLAQRSTAVTIDAVEIDEDAYEQCTENFEGSLWADRLFCYHASAQEFASEIEDTYDLIISNPPFYSDDYKSQNIARDTARFNDALPFEHLIVCAAHLLTETGTFAVIIPKKEEAHFIEIASKNHLFPKRICSVRGSPTSEEKRSLLEFTCKETNILIESLIIETTRHNYTNEYRNLLKEFYLKM
jgi:tRNA1Val (adenine37-N6)-methyltransferase